MTLIRAPNYLEQPSKGLAWKTRLSAKSCLLRTHGRQVWSSRLLITHPQHGTVFVLGVLPLSLSLPPPPVPRAASTPPVRGGKSAWRTVLNLTCWAPGTNASISARKRALCHQIGIDCQQNGVPESVLAKWCPLRTRVSPRAA